MRADADPRDHDETASIDDVAAWADRAMLPGVDPFDGLRGTRVPKFLKRTARGRQIVVQIRKRLPWEVSGVLRTEPFIMAKAAACAVIAHARGVQTGASTRADLTRAVEALFGTQGCLGEGRWGYEFDVQTRWSFYPAGSPNVIVTAFAARALSEAALGLDRDDLLALSDECARFAISDLVTEGIHGRYFRYTPGSSSLIHNANLLAAAMACATGLLRGDDSMLQLGEECALTSVGLLQAKRDWPYGADRGLAWCDNFHTAYDLDALHVIWLATGNARVAELLASGAREWQRTFFSAEGAPYYFADGHGPLDIHSAATAVDVGFRLGASDLVDVPVFERVAEWTAGHLVAADGTRTLYRRGRLLPDRRHFVRWGDAHWALAVSSRAVARAGLEAGQETAIRNGRQGVG